MDIHDSSTTAPSPFRLIAETVADIRTGIKAAFFLPVRPQDFHARPPHLALLLLLEIALILLLSYAAAGAGAEFSRYELAALCFHIPFILGAATLAAAQAGKSETALALAAALIAASFPPEIFGTLLALADRVIRLPLPDWFFQRDHYYRLFGWWAAAGAVAAFRMAGTTLVRRLISAVLFILVAALPLRDVPRGKPWGEPPPHEATRDDLESGEQIMYGQQRMLEKSLAALKPGVRGVPHLYFVGFAGYSDENVFRIEVETVRRLFDERFYAAGRSITLINNPDSVDTLPIASVTALDAVLRRLGTIMGNDDILFLYLTSHGEKGSLTIDFPPLGLRDLDPERLKRMLDEAGIRHRVIAISSCRSGSFIKRLAGPDTLIMTASDADHDSFGCGAQSQFTYFGKAYFDQELRKTRSFTKAFAGARATIAKWETEDGETPSNPQINEGKKIAPLLDKLQSRLDRHGGVR